MQHQFEIILKRTVATKAPAGRASGLRLATTGDWSRVVSFTPPIGCEVDVPSPARRVPVPFPQEHPTSVEFGGGLFVRNVCTSIGGALVGCEDMSVGTRLRSWLHRSTRA